jgi:hypothetical protein
LPANHPGFDSRFKIPNSRLNSIADSRLNSTNSFSSSTFTKKETQDALLSTRQGLPREAGAQIE